MCDKKSVDIEALSFSCLMGLLLFGMLICWLLLFKEYATAVY